jgi:hypothetical protein
MTDHRTNHPPGVYDFLHKLINEGAWYTLSCREDDEAEWLATTEPAIWIQYALTAKPRLAEYVRHPEYVYVLKATAEGALALRMWNDVRNGMEARFASREEVPGDYRDEEPGNELLSPAYLRKNKVLWGFSESTTTKLWNNKRLTRRARVGNKVFYHLGEIKTVREQVTDESDD